MKFFKTILLAALLFAVATISNSLLAQTKYYYAVVVIDGTDTVLNLASFSAIPKVGDDYKGNKILNAVNLSTFESSYGAFPVIDKGEGLAGSYQRKITRVYIGRIEAFQPTSTAYWFADMSSLKEIEHLDYLTTYKIKDMSSMFRGCSKLKGVDFGSWITTSVENMAELFASCVSLEAISFGPKFVTNKVTNMNRMFSYCKSLKSISIETFNMYKVQSIEEMFKDCSSLRYIFYNSEDSIKIQNPNIPIYKGRDCFKGCDYTLSGAKTTKDSYYNCTSDRGYGGDKFKGADNDGYLTKTYGTAEFKKTIDSSYLQKPLISIFYGDELDLSKAYIVQDYHYGVGGKEKVTHKLVSLGATKCAIVGFDSKKLQENVYTTKQIVQLVYYFGTQSCRHTFEVYIQDAVKEYKVTSAPTKTEYTMPITADSIDISGMSIDKLMKSGKTHKVPERDLKPSISGLNSAQLGSQEITLKFSIDGNNIEYKYTINVKDALKEYSVTSAPTKTEYTMPFTVNDLDLSGGMIKKDMWSGSTENLIMNNLKYDVSGLDSKKAGEQEITLTFTLSDGTNFEYKYLISVIDVLKEVSVEAEPSRKEYSVGLTADSLDLSGGVIKKVYYSDSTMEYAMDTMEFFVEGLDEVKAGENTLVLNFDLGDTNFAWEYKINIEEEAAEDSTGSGDEPEKPVAVEDLNASGSAFEAWTSGGVLNVKVVRGGVLEVLSVNGVLLRRISVVSGGSASVALEKGVYVLRFGGEVKKVVLE